MYLYLMKRLMLLLSVCILASACQQQNGLLPLGKASTDLDNAFEAYLKAVAGSSEDLHSVMVLQHGNVLEEKLFVPDTAHGRSCQNGIMPS